MDPMVAMGTASAAPQKGWGGGEEEKWNVKRKTRGGGAAVGRVRDRERRDGEGGVERRRKREKPTSISVKYLIQQKG